MSKDRITLVRWKDAKTDPPESSLYDWYHTDVGGDVLCYLDDKGWCWEANSNVFVPVRPQPTVYTAVFPPGENALTLNDLRDIAEIVESEARHSDGVMGGVQEWWDLAARLRAALAAVSAEGSET